MQSALACCVSADACRPYRKTPGDPTDLSRDPSLGCTAERLLLWESLDLPLLYTALHPREDCLPTDMTPLPGKVRR